MAGRIQQNSLLFSLLAGNLLVETGSQLTASSASESISLGHVPLAKFADEPEFFRRLTAVFDQLVLR
jgi:hypothetical protein